MFRSNAKSYSELRKYLDDVPVIDTHEHGLGICGPIEEPLGFVLGNYYRHDFLSASFGMDKNVSDSNNIKLSMPLRFNAFREIYEKSKHTAYAHGVQAGLKECWGIENIDSAEALAELGEKLKGRDQAFYEKMMTQSRIKAQIVNVGMSLESLDDAEYNFIPIVKGAMREYSGYCRFAFPLTAFHNIHSKADICRLERCTGKTATCLAEYLENFESLLKECVDFGIVCIKDNTAYRRTLDCSNPSMAEAEKVFAAIVSRPRDIFGDDVTRTLDDWLFHSFLRLAAKYDLPVQIHTGHMAGIRNDIEKANAVHLTSVLELHQDVRFDLFHGNWPFMDEFLFLGKNYPNVWLNLCWVQAIDPVYCIELMKRAVMTVPHAKLMAFGGDIGSIEWTVGYLIMARDNVACALSELVDTGWIDMNEARQIAADWFFNNPNEFFRLGL